jgi:hypothetical protein
MDLRDPIDDEADLRLFTHYFAEFHKPEPDLQMFMDYLAENTSV